MNKERNKKTARVIGLSYFLLLGIVNFAATFYFREIRLVDYYILTLTLLPVLFQYRKFHIAIGIIGSFISLYIGVAGIIFNLDPRVQTSQLSFMMGYLLAASLLTASILLIYASTYDPAKKQLVIGEAN